MVTIDYSEKGIVENTELKHTANDTVFKFKSLKKGKTKVTATVYDKSDVRNKTTVCYDAKVLPMSIRKTLRAAAVKAVKEAAPAVHAYEGRVCSRASGKSMCYLLLQWSQYQLFLQISAL